jgi:hypothetical protein
VSRPTLKDLPALPETAVLTPPQLAAWLQVSERQLERIDGIPWVTFGKRSRRALVRSVLTWMQSRKDGTK